MTLQEAKEVPKHITDAFDLVIEYMEEHAHESPDAHARVTQLKHAIQHLGLFVRKSMEEYARSKWDECYQILHDKSYDCVFPEKPEFKP